MKTLQRQSTRKSRLLRSGFTLLELLIVLAIIVAIAAMVAPNLLSSQQDANIQTTRATIKTIEDALKRQAVKNNGVFPEGGSEVIQALAQPWEDTLGQQQQPLLEEVPRDAWNKEFQYAYDPNSDLKPRIWSFGPNGQDDGGSKDSDDVSNLRRDVE